MVALTERVQNRLTLTVEAIAPHTQTLRSLDWDRSRFDIEFGLQNGTTYNSFLIQGDRVALVDSSHEKFRQLYLDALQGLIDPTAIDYLIVSHTEPDHSGLTRDLLALNPNLTVVGSKVALQFLDNLVHQDYQKQQVKSGSILDLGQGHVLEFVSAPNLHWPDTIFTYDRATEILYTCDAFGMHYCSEVTFDEALGPIEADFRYYYDCLMGPNARSVLSALKRMESLGPIQTIATGHGPLLRHHLTEWTGRYQEWSQAQTKASTTVGVFYISDYGYSDRLSQAIAHGITKVGVNVEMVDLRTTEPQDLTEIVGTLAGLVIGTPPNQPPETIDTALSTLLALANTKQAVGLYDSYGGDDEPIDSLLGKCRDAGLKVAFPPIRVKETPSEAIYQLCDESGTDLGQWLTRDKAIQKMKSLDSDLDKALGRISGGLYILTAMKGDMQGAMLASWVVQASFEPLGFTVAVAKDRAIETLMQVGDGFVLNILEEGNYQPLMKHFLKRFPPGADRFAGIKTREGSNGSPILVEALAYLECEVVSRMECSDHWVVYAQVNQGKVSNPDALTAVHHRKVGNHY
ncbi:diflavin flavoprotein [Prochlorothrix hollandica]|uniref:DeoR faimly transcriptional regulator n=1 Tax=Prochlorothrix hollandica PCC 9006 = CALU 1027 TaxID=317619 RepID=A0A0M2PPB9_PROHO|nr:diflavin flavoprotein [Prochlorothrix hollandica]KKI98109.1 DeoR faimly transcriptional regulator [Prochlorothrix hollandica PCC 9006 = CALU 1027]